MSIRHSKYSYTAMLASAPLALALITPGYAMAAQEADGATQRAATLPDDFRLEAIGHRLAVANRDRCGNPNMRTGMMLHDLSSYDAKYRAAVATAYGMSDGVSVRYVVPGSTAETAGLVRKDEIVAIGGTRLADLPALSAGADEPKATYRRVEQFVRLLDTALQRGPAAITVKRGAELVELQLAGEEGCGGRFILSPEKRLNAWADGEYVSVTRKMIQFSESDEELAFVLAHEMAHNILAHNDEDAASASSLFATLGIGAKEVKANEMAADAYAVGLLARAGYDLSAPERFLRKSRKVRQFDLATTHPGITRRIAIINQALAQLNTAAAIQYAGLSPDLAAPPVVSQVRTPMQEQPDAAPIEVFAPADLRLASAATDGGLDFATYVRPSRAAQPVVDSAIESRLDPGFARLLASAACSPAYCDTDGPAYDEMAKSDLADVIAPDRDRKPEIRLAFAQPHIPISANRP